jgi:hypothetical protein
MFYWTEELYRFTKIYNSLSPIMALCVDLKIEGRSPAYIAKKTKKPIKVIYQTIFRAKSRFEKAQIGEQVTNYYTRQYRDLEDCEADD